MSCINYVRLPKFDLIVEAEYVGDTPWSVDLENSNNHKVYVTCNGVTEVFDIWGSLNEPKYFEDYQDGPYYALSIFCNESLIYVNDEIKYMLDTDLNAWEYDKQYSHLESALSVLYEKLLNLGMTVDDLILMSNSEDNYDIEEHNGVEYFIPQG